MMCIGE